MTAGRRLLAAALAGAGATALAQDAPDPPPAPVRELEAVRVTGRRPPTDPFAFRNPVAVEPTVFSRDWDEPPGLEEIGLRGGLVQMGIQKGLELAAEGIRQLPGWKDQVIGAQARPPPLDAAQRDRAMRFQAEGPVPASVAPSTSPAPGVADAGGASAAEVHSRADPDAPTPRPR